MLRRLLLTLLAASALAASVRAETVYFVSKSNGGLYTFNTAGGPVTSLSGAGPGTFTSPSALAMGPDGNLYIGDETDGGSIRRYAMSGGTVSMVVGLSGSNPPFGSGTVAPAAIAFTPGGSMLVGRNPEKRSVNYPSGEVLEVVGWNGGAPTVQNYTSGTALNYQTGLAVAPNGTLYASNTTYGLINLEGNVVRFDASGVYQSVVATDSAGTGRFGPAGLALSGNSLYIASIHISNTFDLYGDIYKTDLTNPDTATNTSTFASITGDVMGPLALLSNGGLLAGGVADPRGLIYQFGPSGDLVNTFNLAGSFGQIGGIVAVPEPGAMLLAAVAGVVLGLRHVSGRLRRS
jgi:sugar lactone lactonase YvrE